MLSLRGTADAGGVERHRTGPRRLLDSDHHGVGSDQLLDVLGARVASETDPDNPRRKRWRLADEPAAT